MFVLVVVPGYMLLMVAWLEVVVWFVDGGENVVLGSDGGGVG